MWDSIGPTQFPGYYNKPENTNVDYALDYSLSRFETVDMNYTNTHKEGIKYFTGSNQNKINDYIENGKYNQKYLMDIKSNIKKLDTAFTDKAVVLPSKALLYKGYKSTSKSERKNFFYDDPYLLKSFTSTSFSPKIALQSMSAQIPDSLVTDDTLHIPNIQSASIRYDNMIDIKNFYDSFKKSDNFPDIMIRFNLNKFSRILICGNASSTPKNLEALIDRGTYIHLDEMYYTKQYNTIFLFYTLIGNSNDILYESKRLDFTSFLREEREMKKQGI